MIGFGGSDAAGLTPAGVRAAVSRHVDLDMPRQARARSVLSLQDMFRSLVVRGGPVEKNDLLVHFRPVDGAPDRDKGRYSDLMDNEWFEDVARPELSDLPGVSADGGAWRFDGLPDPDEFDAAHVRPLDELRSDPLVVVEAALDRRGLSRGGDRREAVVDLVTHLDAVEEATAEELDSKLRRAPVALADVDSILSALPGVARETRTPPDPEEIVVETMADVRRGRALLEQEPTDVWAFDPDAAADAPAADATGDGRASP